MLRHAELTDSLTLLWSILDALHLPSFAVNEDLRVVDFNSSVKKRLLYSREDVLGTSVSDIITTAPAFKPAILSGTVTVLEGTYTKKDGKTAPAKITVIRQGGGYLVVVEDIESIVKIAKRATLRRREINTYNALSEILSKTDDMHEMAGGIVDIIVDILNIDAAWIYFVDEDAERLSLCCFRGVGEDSFSDVKALKAYEYFVGRVLSSGRSLLVRNVSEDPRIPHLNLADMGLQSIVGIPLTVRSIKGDDRKPVGVLGVASKDEDRFTSLDIQFLSTIGNHLGVAVENARLIEDLTAKMKQIGLINEIISIVNSSLTIGHIFRIVASEIKKMVDFDRASINILDENRNFLRIFAVDTKLPTELVKGRVAPVYGTSSGWVAINQKPWINRDLKEEIHFRYDSILQKEGIRSTVSIPLYKDRPLGTLNFDSTLPGKYSEQDLEILLPIAKHLSIAVENAMLFEEVSREKRQWEKTFDAITDMVWIEDMKGKVLRVNKTVIERSGRPELALINRSSGEVMKLLQIRTPAYPSYDLLKGKVKLYHELTRLDGSTYHFWTYPLVDSEGKIYGVVNYLRDVTEQKRLEHQLVRADKLASLGTLVAGIAHEINNPLGIIAGYSEALLDRARSTDLLLNSHFEDFPEYLETINKEIFRCKDILKSLLDFARSSTGTFREIDINELIKEVILLVNYKAKRSNYIIELNLLRDIPKVYADPGALRQLFMNIIMNSFYFMDRNGSIMIETGSKRTVNDGSEVHIKITDNGRGIGREFIGRVFDPFFTTKPIGEGTGLGLPICHRIVTEHNGTIDVESREGEGTTFHIRLPAKKDE